MAGMTSSAPPRPSGRDLRFVVPEAHPVEIQRAALLSSQERSPKVTVLSAPSGYGKSTVLAQYAREAPAPVWVRLNEEARDARSLLTDLAQGARAAGVPLPHWDQLSLVEATSEQLLGTLMEDLNDHEVDLTVCVDGGEHLSADTALLLSSFASLLGDGHRFMLAQRDGAAFNIAPFLARGEGRLLTAEHLTFTEHDTAAAAQQLGAAAGPLAALATYKGWPWGIMVALRTQRSGEAVPATELAQRVLDLLPEHLSAVLPQLSVLEFWSAEGAASLNLTLPDGWLEALQRAGLPMSSVGRGRYVPHDVVREALTEQLRQQPDLWRAMHARAAEQAEAQGEPYSAIRHHVEAGQTSRAVSLAEQLVPRWYRASDWHLAEEALRLIPSADLPAELRSIYALAVLESPNLERGRALLEAQLADEPTATAYFGLILAALRTGETTLMKEYAEAGLAIATQQRDIIQLLRGKALVEQMTGHPEEANRAIDEAISRADSVMDPSLRLSARSVKAFLLQRQTHDEEALEEYERVYQAGITLGLVHRLMPAVQQLATLYPTFGRTAEARQLLEDYRRACERSYPLAIPVVEGSLGNVLYQLGRPDEATAVLWKTYTHFTEQKHTTGMIETLYRIYFMEVLIGDRARVTNALRQVQSMVGDEPDLSVLEMLAYEAYAAGDLDQALSLANEAAERTTATQNRTFVLTETLRGTIHHARQQLSTDDANRLRTALEIQPYDILDLMTVPFLVAPLLEEYVRRGWHTEFFQDVLRRLTYREPQSTVTVQMHVQTLGVLTASINEQPVKLGHGSALEALTYLILHPEARQDEVADQVWGHGDLKRARQSAQVARNAINAAFREAIQEGAPMIGDLLPSAGQGRKNPQWQINAGVTLTTDVQAFLASRSPEDMLRVHPQSFLAGSDSEWVIHYRQVLTSHAVQVLEDAAETADPLQGLPYLVRAADLTQQREQYETVLVTAQRLGQAELSDAAARALALLERGEVASLGPQWPAQ